MPAETLRLPATLLAALALACASSTPDGPPPPPPGPGSSLAESLASLGAGAPAGASVRVDELRLLRVDVEPWEALDPDDAAGDVPGERQALIAHRTCRMRQGVRTRTAPRASWLLFRGGRLEAFDHWSFGPACAGRHHFRPARGADVALERDLVRYVAQRFPDAAPRALDQLAMGHAYLEAGRVEDAEAMLAAARRRIDALAPTPGDVAALSEEERASRAAEAEELHRAAASLRAEIRAARRGVSAR
jgi:hypothetical protein